MKDAEDTTLGLALKTQVDLSNRLTKAEERFEQHKDTFLEMYEALADVLAWYSSNSTEVDKMTTNAQWTLFKAMDKLESLARKAVIM
jgi:hypothetical protein